MLAPNAEQIEGATDSLAKLDPFIYHSQREELESAMSAPAAKKLGVSFPIGEEFRVGYELGVQTARQVMKGSVELALHNADPNNIL